MITVSKRQKEIVEYLIKQTDYVTICDIAMKFSISDRTCRNDLSSIGTFLKESGLSLSRKTGKGVFLNCTPEEKRKISELLKTADTRFYNRRERENLVIALLLISETTTFQELAEVCLVSKQTVINQFDSLEQRLRRNTLAIEKVPGRGLHLKGEEKSIRFQFLELLGMELCKEEIYSLFSEDKSIQTNFPTATAIVNDIQELKKIQFVDFKRIQLILSYILSRIENGHSLRKNWVYKDDSDLKKVIEKYISTDSEQCFICSLIQAERTNQPILNMSTRDEAQMISQELISSLAQVYPIERDSLREIIDGLTVHLRAAIYRSRSKIHIRNELLNEVKMSVSLMFEFTLHEMCKVEEKYGIVFDENEIAYIAMYLTSIYETSIKETVSLDILIICSYGVATSAVLKLRLERALPDCNIWGPCSLSGVDEYLQANKIDLIVSANDYTHDHIPVIVVEPLLTQKDLEQIRQKLYHDSYSLMCSTFLKSYSLQVDRHCIGSYISPQDIQILDVCDSWNEAIRIASSPLLKKGDIEQRYIEEMINAVRNYGTYMVLTPEIAYVHAGVNDGIHRNCSALLLLKKPVIFGNFNKKKICAVVVLGINNRKEDSDLLNLAYILGKEENLKRLKEKDITIKDILELHD